MKLHLLHLCLAAAGLAHAQTPQAASAPSKDIVIDSAPADTAAPAVVPPPLSPSRGPAGAALAELGLDLLRQPGSEPAGAVNVAVSPVSLAAGLGLVHAGSGPLGARELAGLVGSRTAGERLLASHLPRLLAALQQPGSGVSLANRVWIARSAGRAVPAAYAERVQQRYQADAALLNFADAEAARRTINRWAADKTAQRIPTLLPPGAVTPASRMVLTSALHFKSPWLKPFDPARTAAKPFHTAPGAIKLVPTMSDEREVRMGQVGQLTVMELPFAAPGYAVLLAMPPQGRDLQAALDDIDGSDLATWGDPLKPLTCRLEMPKLQLAPKPQALKTTLQALGVEAVFGPGADFTPLLGRAAKGVYLDNVYQSVAVTLDEQGGEAAAATAAVGLAKSFSAPAPVCAVNRPFVFAIVHKPTGAPLFVGRIVDPSLP
ncbi:serpin family protein [Roseateles sp. LYH14W]|uniref:Serpin family protein n=1 Tax=Pelomonas parva TaxID=3299032 RepID=A0ABW7F711_9BURK